MDDDPFDLEKLRMPVPEVQIGPAAKAAADRVARRREREFIRFPRVWEKRLEASNSLNTYRVALVVLFRHWKAGEKPFALSNITMSTGGVNRQGKWRALQELERLGLIRVEKRPKKVALSRRSSLVAHASPVLQHHASPVRHDFPKHASPVRQQSLVSSCSSLWSLKIIPYPRTHSWLTR